MSSSNAVSVIYIDEPSYALTPDPADVVTAHRFRMVSEGLSGTPNTTRSATIRKDRATSGQVVTGLEVGGPINFELARDNFFDKFFSLALMNSWQAATSDVSGVSFTLDGGDDQRGTLSGTGVGIGVSVGDVLKVTASSAEHVFQVITVTDDDNLIVACMRREADFAGGVSRRPAYIEPGSTISSVTLAKAYEDVLNGADERSQTYSGGVVSGFNLNIQDGSTVNGSFDIRASGYEIESPSYQQQVIDEGGSITDAPTAQHLSNLEIPVITADGVATDFCIESISISVDNGLTPQNCLGKLGPQKYELGSIGINVELGVYLSDPAYAAFQAIKLSQTPLSIAFALLNGDGGYAFSMASVQVAFEDASAQGENQAVMIEPSGPASIGANGEKPMRIYQL